MWGKVSFWSLALLVFLLSACAEPLGAVWDSTQLDPGCAHFPPTARAERTLAEHEREVRALEAVHPGHIWVELDRVTCPGRAQVIIYCEMGRDRKRVETFIGGDTFLGIPYRMVNP